MSYAPYISDARAGPADDGLKRDIDPVGNAREKDNIVC
jgi:hypothetical protein